MPDVAARYDWECRHVLHRADQDVGFWLELARSVGSPILELACGTGRLTIELARAGLEVVGLDNDPVMLAAAKRRSQAPEPITLVAADMRRFALSRRFPLVFVGYNSLQLLTEPGDMVACLSLARDHLAPGGLVGVEVTDFQRGGADGPDDQEEDGTLVPLADAEGIRLAGSLVHDLAARTSRYRRRFAGDGWALEDDVVVRSLDQAELETIIQQANLTVARCFAAGATIRVLAAAPS
ncbi:MAG: class I SAM-dependent methyltransferase [Actinomycetota bacterium]|nr:class I SAM-dependent methyltransferase [Actinomycetota bacterium]